MKARKAVVLLLLTLITAPMLLAQQKSDIIDQKTIQKAREMGISVEELLMIQEKQEEKKRQEERDKMREILGKEEGEEITPEDKMLLRKRTRVDTLHDFRVRMKQIDEILMTEKELERKRRLERRQDPEDEDQDYLEVFGLKTFTFSPSQFEGELKVPVPSSYVLGPGDEVVITMWGTNSLQHTLTVSQNGDIFIPDVAQVNVNGLNPKEAEEKIYGVMAQRYSSLLPSAGRGATSQLDVSTGKLRTVKVYVLGEVDTPGLYSLPALSNAFSAIYFSGGPTINGSLRNVKLLRGDKVLQEVDLYDYLIKGDKLVDVALKDQDVIFVPSTGNRVAVTGAVKREAIYEMKDGETISDALRFAGGLAYDAYFQKLHINRIVPFEQRHLYDANVLSLDVTFNSIDEIETSTFEMYDGDIVIVKKLKSIPENMARIKGAIRQPGMFEVSDEVRTVADLIRQADGLMPEAFKARAALVRTKPDGKEKIVGFSPELALAGDPKENIMLKSRDIVEIYSSAEFFRQGVIEISGAVKEPGEYPGYEGMRVSDLIMLAGGLTDTATTRRIEVTRLDTTRDDIYHHKFIVDFPQEYWKADPENDLRLLPYDQVLIKPNPLISFGKQIKISGEVLYPGQYSILTQNEKLFDLIDRAGGFQKNAYKGGIHVVRENEFLKDTTFQLIPDTLQTFELIQERYYRSLTGDFANIIPIEWSEIEEDTSSIYNLILQPGDSVVIPSDPRVVVVSGEVGIPSTVLYEKGKSLAHYIQQAGGYTGSSDTGAEIVILPNGRKWEPSGWFFLADPEIPSGSTILVPTELRTQSDFWPIVRDMVSVISSAAVLILTILQIKNN